VRLEPSDLLVGFTGGISEAMNSSDEEGGEQRLIEAVRVYERERRRRFLVTSCDRLTVSWPALLSLTT
jgi:serine phosphatase RsbU (regulator of sigma subunit)